MHNEEQQTDVSGIKHIELEEHQRKGSVQFKEVDIYKLGRLKTANDSEGQSEGTGAAAAAATTTI